MRLSRFFPLVLACVLLGSNQAALACAACYGQSDSAMAKGMNMGIFTLLGFIGLVLVGVASFFMFIIRRAASMQPAAEPVPGSN
jgi:heme/copper-type cytochrome/quinol oxidase subunit 2